MRLGPAWTKSTPADSRLRTLCFCSLPFYFSTFFLPLCRTSYRSTSLVGKVGTQVLADVPFRCLFYYFKYGKLKERRPETGEKKSKNRTQLFRTVPCANQLLPQHPQTRASRASLCWFTGFGVTVLPTQLLGGTCEVSCIMFSDSI